MNPDSNRTTRIDYPPDSRLIRMRALSRLLDNSIMLPGGYRIGIDPLLGLLPGVGDVAAAALSLWLVYDAGRLGISKRVLARMLGNIVIETLAGSVPVLGDFFDAAWKANARNMRLVELNYSPTLKPRSTRDLSLIMASVVAVMVIALGAAAYIAFSLLRAAWLTLFGG